MKICIYDVSNYDIADIIKKILDKWAVDLVHINNCCHCLREWSRWWPLSSLLRLPLAALPPDTFYAIVLDLRD